MCASALIKLYLRQEHESLEADQTWNQIKLILLLQWLVLSLESKVWKSVFGAQIVLDWSYSLYFLTPHIIVVIFLMIECQIYLPVVLYSGLTLNPINPFNHELTNNYIHWLQRLFFCILFIFSTHSLHNTTSQTFGLTWLNFCMNFNFFCLILKCLKLMHLDVNYNNIILYIIVAIMIMIQFYKNILIIVLNLIYSSININNTRIYEY